MSPSILSTNSTAYSYQYLDKGEFRLIKLLPGRKDDPEDVVKCHIFTFTLSNPQPYVALSYAWGDISDKRKILIGPEEIAISVSASLESALRALRDPGLSTWLWADALSINQQDALEKAQQVRLMPRIYHRAELVAIWLGPSSEDSDLGMALIKGISDGVRMPQEITARTLPPFSEQNFAAVVALFEREYWHRLWVVQEGFNARSRIVYCGQEMLPWEAFQTASDVFRKNRDVLDRSFHPGYSNRFYKARFGSYTQVLLHEGPGSLDGVGTRTKFIDGDNPSDRMVFQDLLEVMQTCRRKLSSDPRDKVFGILGVLLEEASNKIKVDYSIPVKDVYTNIFRAIVEKTKSLDILFEAIHSPSYTNKHNLPSWAPDWSHAPSISPIAMTRNFSASRKAQVVVDFTQRNKLKISAIPLGSIKHHGITVGTRCTVSDYLMAFLEWRACLLQAFDGEPEGYLRWLKERFCLALSLEHTPEGYEALDTWMDACHYVFASTIRDRIPKLPIDYELERCTTNRDFQMDYNTRRIFLQEHFASNMMGRCFCITDEKRIGLGTGFMTRGDVVVVPLGCSTPMVLRPDGDEYRFVGDVYIQGYMFGKAVEECNNGLTDRQVGDYVIH